MLRIKRQLVESFINVDVDKRPRSKSRRLWGNAIPPYPIRSLSFIRPVFWGRVVANYLRRMPRVATPFASVKVVRIEVDRGPEHATNILLALT